MGSTGMIYTATMVFSLIVLIYSSPTVGYDYFQFTLQYQPAVCNSNGTPCKDPPDKLFTVHGLWPSNFLGPDPEYCKNKTLDSRKIANLTAQLNIIWPNVYDRTDNIGFWSRQWEKHGICGSPAIKNDIHYFETVIKMYITEKQNVSEILLKAKIKPEGKKWTRKRIVDAIRNGTDSKRPKLKCQKNTRMTELVEVTLCRDYDLTHFIDCPNLIEPGSPYFCPKRSIQY
uniref:S-RNase n=1 Tax=Malus domestica TaxID=3750 RepID=A0A2U8LML7_MALDO|nr:S-RNase [Malus domestica]